MRRLLAAVLVALPGPALASPVSVSWTGTVVQANFDPTLVGQTITGAFTFDPEGVTPSVSNPAVGGQQALYPTRHVSSFSVAGLSGQVDDQFIFVINDNGLGNFDQFSTNGFDTATYTGDLIGGLPINTVGVPFTGPTSVLDGIGIPESLSPSDFTFSILGRLDRGPDGLTDDVRFRVDSFTYSVEGTGVVPLPATAVLLLAALGALAASGARRPM